MYIQTLDHRDRFSRVGALDIETDGFDGRTNNLVAIGVGYYEVDAGPSEITVITRAETNNNEIALVNRAFDWLAQRQPQGVATYNGADFDLPFLRDRLRTLGTNDRPSLTGQHIDLYPPRQRAAALADEKWPSLEECLAANNISVYDTIWDGDVLDGSRFGSDLAPIYLAALEKADHATVDELNAVIRSYAAADVEATIALYEADAGRSYDPTYEFGAHHPDV